MTDDSNMVIVQTAFEARGEAETMARNLVEARLAACVQMHGPVLSTYQWRSELTQSEEYVLTIKAPATRASKIEDYIKAHHTYTTPEIIVVDALASRAYGRWAQQECS